VKPDQAAHQQTRILFFDDDADILELCSIILRMRGYEVFTRATCDHVEDSVTEVAPDIIFMDGRIPDVGGVEATRQIKANKNLRKIPVVFFSANADVNYLSTQAGADAYLPKPFDISELETVIHRTLKSGVHAAA
jgi:two-component system cell cycle response regulator DivK